MDKFAAPKLDLTQIRARLSGADGPSFWKSLDELVETPEFKTYLKQEFPRLSAAAPHLGRREFMKLMGASLALAGVSACGGPPQEQILPYVRAPEEVIPGKPLFFATAHTLSGFANGVLVESNMGRPIKVEGNASHPVSHGATDIFAQAAVLELWDPNRSQAVVHEGQISTWETFLAAITDKLSLFERTQGAGLRVLTETVTSPTLTAGLRSLLAKYPKAQWRQYEPVTRDSVYAGARLAFGEALEPRYHFDKARRILSLDADFLGSMPGGIRYAQDFTDGRRVEVGHLAMNRLYAVETTLTITGAMADHRWPLKAGEIEALAFGLAARLGIGMASDSIQHAPLVDGQIKTLVDDLTQRRGESLIIAGDYQLPAVHALAHAMNEALGNLGKTVTYTEPAVSDPADQVQSLNHLVEDMHAGRVDTLIIVGGNPVYNAPTDIPFIEALTKVRLSAHLSLYDDETSARTNWHIPETHYLETWGDARAIDGTATIQQPLIAPLYQSKSAHQVLATLTGDPRASAYERVRGYWQNQYKAGDFEQFWQAALREGVVRDTALPEKTVSVRPDLGARLPAAPKPASEPRVEKTVQIIFKPDPTVWDGRFAANAWLQELPKPMTALTWDNAALMSLDLARRLTLENEELVELRLKGRAVRAAVWIVPGHPDDAVTVTLGYGRTRGAGSANGAGFNAYRLRTADNPWVDSGLEIVKTGETYTLAVTQQHHRMEGRHDVRETTLKKFTNNPRIFHEDPYKNPPFSSLYPDYKYDNYRWGMTVNLNTCIGCKACTIACQAENNIPVVGKGQVQMGREMHWLRVDHYYKGPVENPATYFQPVPCMHCEHAPCEPVCPVEASIHDEDGLNVQVYNRCIGTRWCSNNCPYKVRRFNFLKYADAGDPHLAALRNPDVTVRSRGVMEKCTYCVQRINAAKIEAEKQNRRVRDGEIVTACQAVCPTNAIVFGDLNDPDAEVRKSKQDPLNYSLLAELGTRPRTTYLAKLSNPNPALNDG